MTGSDSAAATPGLDAHVGGWPSEGLERVEECPVCSFADRRLLHDQLSDSVFCAAGSWSLYGCEHCGSAYLDPRPTPEAIHIAYGRYFTHSDPQPPVSIATLSGVRRFRRALANGYRNWRYGSRFVPASRLGVVTAWIVPGQREVLDNQLRYLPRVWPGARLLDVGAGNGRFLVKARDIGWEVAGVEPDPEALAAARRGGLDARKGGIECFDDESASFDVVTMSHVIEHVHDPRRVLKRAFALLRPGGCLYLDTPNIDSYGHKKFGRHWRGLEPPRHLVLFNWESLEWLLSEIGFDRVKRLPRTDVYPNLAAISRAIGEGLDLETEKPLPTLGDRLVGWAIRARTPFRFKDSEFVSLMAYKQGPQ